MTTELRDYIASITTPPALHAGALPRLMKNEAKYLSRDIGLELGVRLTADLPGCIMEFGVASGGSTRVLRHHSKKPIYALDSFEGLRESYERLEVGHFAGPVPDIPGVNFVKGYFEDTCTEELAARVGRVAFAHLDADLYSSTLFALRWLTPLFVDGSMILFDEFIGSDRAEARAFAEWQAETGMTVVRLAEFDRDPSGGGDIPDKRILFQVVIEQPAEEDLICWTANCSTALKVSTAVAATLKETEKVQVLPGDVMTADRFLRHGSHGKVFGVRLNGQALAKPDWFILRQHWDRG